MAMNRLGNGLLVAKHPDALSVKETELSMLRRLGASEADMLVVQSNLANAYGELGRFEDALRMHRDVYSARLELQGEHHSRTLTAANNYATSLLDLQCYAEAKALLRKTLPVARRILTDDNELTLRMRWSYAIALHDDHSATLNDFREAVTTLEDATRIARRLLGPSHPLVEMNELRLRNARATARARELNVSSLADELEAMTPT